MRIDPALARCTLPATSLTARFNSCPAAGVGLVGQALCHAGATHVLLTDQPHQLPLLRANLKANFGASSERVAACALCWERALPAEADGAWDLVVGSDLVYDEDALEPLAATLAALLKRRPGALGLLALPDRAEFALEAAHKGDVAVEMQPDYVHLFNRLAQPDFEIHTRMIGTVSSEDAGTCDSAIHILLICCDAMRLDDCAVRVAQH